MKIPSVDDIDGQRELFFDSFPGSKTFQLMPDHKNVKSPFNVPKVVQMKGEIYPRSEIPDGFLYDRSDWMDFGYIKRLEDFNLAGACISLTINETDKKGRTKENIIKVRSIFADIDDKPLPTTWQLTPSMIVESSKGKYHIYFFVEAFPLELFEQTQAAVAYNLKSDPAIKDLSRAMRIVGFYHTKKARFLSRIIQYTGLKYSIRDFDVFPPEPVKQWSAKQWDNTVSDPDREFTGQYGTGEGGRNCFIAKRLGGMKKRGLSWNQIEIEAMKEAAACSPPLSELETLAILKSMKRY